MDPGTIKAGAVAVSAIVRAGKDLAALNKSAAKAADLQERISLYMRSVQKSITELGKERQAILRAAQNVDVRKAKQVDAVFSRLDTYLRDDNIRPRLKPAVAGLKGCADRVNAEAHRLNWRLRTNKDKAKSAKEFINLLENLNGYVEGLQTNFLPQSPSGQGVMTLQPIHNVLQKVREARKCREAIDYDERDEELTDALSKAYADESNTNWMNYTAKVETLLAQMSLAFRWEMKSEKRPSRKGG
jgi:hypothetical protein